MKLCIKQDLLDVNYYSRPQVLLNNIKGIVIHWVANPNSTAKNNRDFFNNRKSGNTGYGSAHYIINLNGDIIQCIPDNEIAYHVGSNTYTNKALKELSTYPNDCTIGIECTHIDWTGKMTDDTYNSLIELCVFLLKKYNLTEKNLWLHKEVVGWKDCHKWFVDNPNEWLKFKEIIEHKLYESKHWAEPFYEYLLHEGLNINEKRFDDNITRGEAFRLMELVIKNNKK